MEIKKIKPTTLCIDFDGTCVTHEFPHIGKDIGAEPVLRELVENGHKLILFTMRSDKKDVHSEHHLIHSEAGQYLTDAVNWFKERNSPLYGINTNPTQSNWTTSPKAYGEIFIDDAGLGCPLVYGDFDGLGNGEWFDRPHVDWKEVRNKLVLMGVLPNN
jgi:hypothetical protein